MTLASSIDFFHRQEGFQCFLFTSRLGAKTLNLSDIREKEKDIFNVTQTPYLVPKHTLPNSNLCQPINQS